MKLDSNNIKRCRWATDVDPIYVDYHDNEWGMPSHEDRYLFEMLSLEGAQAGLSWITILRKRAAYKEAFDDFEVDKICLYNAAKIAELINNSGIVRNKLKINSVVNNAKIFIEIQKEFTSFDQYLWGFVAGKTIVNSIPSHLDLPAQSDLSAKISKELKKRGMKFVGPVIIQSYLEAVGIFNNHENQCFRKI